MEQSTFYITAKEASVSITGGVLGNATVNRGFLKFDFVVILFVVFYFLVCLASWLILSVFQQSFLSLHSTPV